MPVDTTVTLVIKEPKVVSSVYITVLSLIPGFLNVNSTSGSNCFVANIGIAVNIGCLLSDGILYKV
jgi:hypothetical protein